MRTRIAGGVAIAAAASLLLATPAYAQDPEAPKGAPKHWLANEDWINYLWLPYEEARLYKLIGHSRGEVFRWVRDEKTMAELARESGWEPRALAEALVEPQKGHVSAAKLRELADRAERTLTQGHLGQHILFHALHQTAVPEKATVIFGTRDRDEFLKMRRAELSPLQICELNGKSRVEAQKGVSDALREAAARGVRDGSLPAAQAQVMLDRQLRQVPRWLGQNRYNGPSGGANKPDLPEADAAKHPSISANGLTVVWDAYRADVAQAERFGEIHVARRRARPAAVLGHPAAGRDPATAVGVQLRRLRERHRGRVRDGRVDLSAGQARGPDDGPRARPRHGQGHARQPRLPGEGRADPHGLQPGALGRRQHRRLRGHRRRQQRRAVRERSVGRGSQGQARAPRDRRVARRRLPAGGRRRRAVRRLHLGRSGQQRAHARLQHRAQDRKTTLVSRAAAPAAGDAYDPSVSYDGRHVAFTSRARNLGGDGHADIYVRDLRAGTTRLVTGAIKADAGSPSLSADGRYVAFVVRVGQPNGKRESLRSRVWRHDLQTGQNVLVSRAAGARGEPGDGLQTDPAISADGQRVAFASTGGNLGEGKPDGIAGVYVRDVARGTTTLLSTHAERPGAGPDVVRVVAPAGSGVAVLAGLLVFWRRRSARSRPRFEQTGCEQMRPPRTHSCPTPPQRVFVSARAAG